ncbi:hypothetical protein [Nonomuraea dietziae]|uniref:Uncharacterized protein n=1 Tax=Nonomuraea dietziae TaxID=65515 RepID=A0A7W5Y8B2_9ACTN|nr:hypothetical protein [Nonomuraea dietziae]MBB3728436.1 hypothetical protein [Nonomuraea dietziae]
MIAAALPVNRLMMAFMAGTAGTLVGLRVWAGVVAPEISPEKLRSAARSLNKLADALDGGEDPRNGLAHRADQAYASVVKNNAGAGIDSFATVYNTNIRPLPAAFVADLRVVACVCTAYAKLVDDVRRRFAEVENELLQLVWMVMFQPMTTWLYAVATVRIVKLIKTARLLKALFGANATRIFSAGFPAYALSTLVYATVDGIAYASGSVGIKAMVNLSHGQPVGPAKENAAEFLRIWTGNTGYVLGYDAAKFPMRNLPSSRVTELFARLAGSGLGYTPAYNLSDGVDGQIATTPEEWEGKLEGHGLRALIFPPGWLPGR